MLLVLELKLGMISFKRMSSLAIQDQHFFIYLQSAAASRAQLYLRRMNGKTHSLTTIISFYEHIMRQAFIEVCARN